MDQVNQPNTSLATPGKRAAAFSVHVFTALGAGIALLALLEAVREHWVAMFAWQGCVGFFTVNFSPEACPNRKMRPLPETAIRTGVLLNDDA